jgi:tetratricopeptide (TPR) repeat protein
MFLNKAFSYSSRLSTFILFILLLLFSFKIFEERYIVATNLCSLSISRESFIRSRNLAGEQLCASSLDVQPYALLPFYSLNNFPLPEASLKESEIASGDYPVGSLIKGQLFWSIGKVDQALYYWRSFPDIDVYFANQSVAVFNSGELTKAKDLAEIAQLIDAQTKPEKLTLYETFCDGWQKYNSPEIALEWCRLMAEQSVNGWSQIDLAQVQYELGDTSGSIDTLNWAVEAGNPEAKGAAYQKLGQIYLDTGELSKSIEYFESAIELGRTNQWIYSGLAKSQLKLGSVEEACMSLSKAQDEGFLISDQTRKTFKKCFSTP